MTYICPVSICHNTYTPPQVLNTVQYTELLTFSRSNHFLVFFYKFFCHNFSYPSGAGKVHNTCAWIKMIRDFRTNELYLSCCRNNRKRYFHNFLFMFQSSEADTQEEANLKKTTKTLLTHTTQRFSLFRTTLQMLEECMVTWNLELGIHQE